MKFSYNPLWNMILFIVAISFIFYYLSQRKGRGDRLREEEYSFFDRTEIKGRLVAIGTALEITSFQVDNSDRKFIFEPEIAEDGSFFIANSEVGDSIIKPAFGKFILVKGKERTYHYNFKHPR